MNVACLLGKGVFRWCPLSMYLTRFVGTVRTPLKCCFNLVDVDSDSNDGFEETTILLVSATLSTLLNDFDLIAHVVKALQSLDKRDCFAVSSALRARCVGYVHVIAAFVGIPTYVPCSLVGTSCLRQGAASGGGCRVLCLMPTALLWPRRPGWHDKQTGR
jgi:hypothetical protein